MNALVTVPRVHTNLVVVRQPPASEPPLCLPLLFEKHTATDEDSIELRDLPTQRNPLIRAAEICLPAPSIAPKARGSESKEL
jgi:hypothetical protein